MINMKRMKILLNNDKYEKKEDAIKQWYIWREIEWFKMILNIKRKRISFMLTLAPCSTKYLTISVKFAFIAILRGHLLLLWEFHYTMTNMKRNRII